ncbi:MAG: TldD/PmbA family protein [Kosmotoga sp.]|nr:MAG: TldD/PmbA family protein [Kosmotoga sp.]
MIEKLKKMLSKTKNINGWKIVEDLVEDKELFFIKKKLDMNRAKKVRKFYLTVYKDFDEGGKTYRGSAEVKIHPTMKENEIKEVIEDSAYSAKFVKNPWYPMVKPISEKDDNHSENHVLDRLYSLAESLYDSDVYKEGWINSSEFFLNHLKRRIINSEGVDCSYEKNRLFAEYVTTWKNKEKEEAELYWQILTSRFSGDFIKKKGNDSLMQTAYRANAVSTPSVGDIPVIISGDNMISLMAMFLAKASSRMVYEKISTFNIGDNVQGEDIKGDKLSITIDPYIEGSYYSVPYDKDGLPLRKVNVIEDGVIKKFWGNTRYSYYLETEPTGSMTNMFVKSGKTNLDKLRSGEYLEVREFSDFQTDHTTGDFGGEIRMGWYCDGKDRIPVTGGSISGNLDDIKNNLSLSNEAMSVKNYSGPFAIKLNNVSISGS